MTDDPFTLRNPETHQRWLAALLPDSVSRLQQCTECGASEEWIGEIGGQFVCCACGRLYRLVDGAWQVEEPPDSSVHLRDDGWPHAEEDDLR
jgi:hypothetical protein